MSAIAGTEYLPTFPATLTVYTVSGTTHCCDRHAQALASLMRFMGAHTIKTPAPPSAQCANCINEHKAGK